MFGDQLRFGSWRYGSRGIWTGTLSASVWTVLGYEPLRLFPDPNPARSTFSQPRWSLISTSRARTEAETSTRSTPPPGPTTPAHQHSPGHLAIHQLVVDYRLHRPISHLTSAPIILRVLSAEPTRSSLAAKTPLTKDSPPPSGGIRFSSLQIGGCWIAHDVCGPDRQLTLLAAVSQFISGTTYNDPAPPSPLLSPHVRHHPRWKSRRRGRESRGGDRREEAGSITRFGHRARRRRPRLPGLRPRQASGCRGGRNDLDSPSFTWHRLPARA